MGFSWKMKPLKFRCVHPVPTQAEESGQPGPLQPEEVTVLQMAAWPVTFYCCTRL